VSAESESLVYYLDQQRDSVLAIVDDLPEAALRRTVSRRAGPAWG
jgi:hypothetical protein